MADKGCGKKGGFLRGKMVVKLQEKTTSHFLPNLVVINRQII